LIGGWIIKDQVLVWLKRRINTEMVEISGVTIFEANLALEISKVTTTAMTTTMKVSSITTDRE